MVHSRSLKLLTLLLGRVQLLFGTAWIPGSKIYRTTQFPESSNVLLQIRFGSNREIERNQTGWGCSSVGRAVALQAIGQEFDSPQLHHCYLQGAQY
jgi:hypothetical protein